MSIDSDYAEFSAILDPVLREQLVVGKKYISPIKRKNGMYEKTPSFRVFEGKGEYKGYLYWCDWGLTNQKGSRPLDLIMALHGVEREEAERMLNELDLPETVEIPKQRRNRLYMIDRQQLNRAELNWWRQYHVSEKTLKKYNVYGVISLYSATGPIFERGVVKTKAGTFDGRIAFSYRGGKDLNEYQYYCPDPKSFFREGNFIYGWDQLPYRMDKLLIVSGMKDGLVAYEATGIPFLAGSGEGAYLQFEKLLPVLSKRAKQIWTLMDPDPPGQDATEAFRTHVGIDPLPFRYVDKKQDVADLSKRFGLDWVQSRIINSL
jgi:hypothetical protein